MFTKKIVTFFAITLFAFISAASEINAQKMLPEGSSSLQSVNYSSHHMSYDKTNKGFIEMTAGDDAKRRSSFTIKKGKYGYTFEALYQPGWYLYVEGNKNVTLKQMTNPTDEDLKRISFTSEQGQAKPGDDLYTFRPFMFADLFLRHCNKNLIVHTAKADKTNPACSNAPKVMLEDITWRLAEPFTAIENPAAGNKNVSFRSENYKDMYIHHNNDLGDITRTLSPTRKDATFKIVSGLSGAADTVSIESVDKPGHFLRHQSYRVKLQKLPPEMDELFNKDATFKIIPGNSGEGKSFESINIPGYYIRHCGFQLWLDNNKMQNQFCEPKDNVYRLDTSYIIIDGLAQ